MPAGKTSAFPDAPADFLDWLRDGPPPEATATTFAPRALFGRYLGETLARNAAPGATLRIVRDPAASVDVWGTVRLTGIETDAHGALVGADRRVSDVLFALEPLRQGVLWESTEIRAQAAALAAWLLEPR